MLTYSVNIEHMKNAIDTTGGTKQSTSITLSTQDYIEKLIL